MMEGIKIPKALIGSWYSHVWDFFFNVMNWLFYSTPQGEEEESEVEKLKK